jgi:hypothetical protein
MMRILFFLSIFFLFVAAPEIAISPERLLVPYCVVTFISLKALKLFYVFSLDSMTETMSLQLTIGSSIGAYLAQRFIWIFTGRFSEQDRVNALIGAYLMTLYSGYRIFSISNINLYN